MRCVRVYSEMQKSSGMTDRSRKGETIELCRWTVDISSLPSFQENANVPAHDGFYTGKLNGKTIKRFR
jgi:hypothetical protein